MMCPEEIVIPLEELTPDRYRQNPIWTWWDEDEDLVTPVDPSALLTDEHDFDAVWIHCDFALSDGTAMDGRIGLVWSTGQFYVLGFFRGSEEHTYGILMGDRERNDLLAWLGKPIEEVSPIRYSAPYTIGASAPRRVVGEIDLTVW
jgi:hypothetical protein